MAEEPAKMQQKSLESTHLAPLKDASTEIAATEAAQAKSVGP